MHQINSNTLPVIFLNKFKRPTHNYPTNFTRTNYSIPTFKLNKSKYRTSIRGPTLWKNIPADREKTNERYHMLHKFYRFLAPNVVLYIPAFGYYGFYERTFFYYMYIFKMSKKIKKKKKKNNNDFTKSNK